MRKFISVILSVVLLIACNKEKVSEPPAQVVADQSVQNPQTTKEFYGTISSTLNLDPSIPPMQCTGDLPGIFLPDHFLHGNAIHFGQLNGQESSLHHVSCNLSVPDRQLTASVSGQIVAANGDRIYYSGNDVIDITNLLTAQGTTGGIQGTWNITGGTGRFEDASGSFTISGLVNFITGTFSATASGTITY
jgi:hypothetical protein